jgi:hypothetical protein
MLTVELYALKGNRDNVAAMSGGVVTDASDSFDQVRKTCIYANEWSRSKSLGRIDWKSLHSKE